MMSTRALLQLRHRLTQVQRGLQHASRQYHHASLARSSLLRSSPTLRHLHSRSWPTGAYSVHGVSAVRSISFARALPSLFAKLLRIPVLVGTTAITGVAYIQYQATRKLQEFFNYTIKG